MTLFLKMPQIKKKSKPFPLNSATIMASQGKVSYNIINLYLLSYGNVTVEIVNNIEHTFLIRNWDSSNQSVIIL